MQYNQDDCADPYSRPTSDIINCSTLPFGIHDDGYCTKEDIIRIINNTAYYIGNFHNNLKYSICVCFYQENYCL